MNSLFIIIPVYNEEKNINALLNKWLKTVPKYFKKNINFLLMMGLRTKLIKK